MASSKKKTIKNLYSLLVKRYPQAPVAFPKELKLIDLIVYAIFLENNSFGNADDTIAIMEKYFVGLNEVRVSTANELADVFTKLDRPVRTCERLRHTLQWIFNKTYSYSLEDIRNKGMEETAEYLKNLPFLTPFIRAFVFAFAFHFEDIPLDEGALRIFRLLDLVEINAENQEEVEGLASLLAPNERQDFFVKLHQLGVEMMNESQQQAIIGLLKQLDPEVTVRSWIPLIDNDALTDPVLIARMVMKSEPKPKLSPAMLDDDLIEDELGEDRMIEDESSDIVESVEYDAVPYEEEFNYSGCRAEDGEQEVTSKHGKKGKSAKSSDEGQESSKSKKAEKAGGESKEKRRSEKADQQVVETSAESIPLSRRGESEKQGDKQGKSSPMKTPAKEPVPSGDKVAGKTAEKTSDKVAGKADKESSPASKNTPAKESVSGSKSGSSSKQESSGKKGAAPVRKESDTVSKDTVPAKKNPAPVKKPEGPADGKKAVKDSDLKKDGRVSAPAPGKKDAPGFSSGDSKKKKAASPDSSKSDGKKEPKKKP